MNSRKPIVRRKGDNGYCGELHKSRKTLRTIQSDEKNIDARQSGLTIVLKQLNLMTSRSRYSLDSIYQHSSVRGYFLQMLQHTFIVVRYEMCL